MGILKKIWYWLFRKKEVETYEDIKAKALKDVHIECNGGYVGNNINYAAPEEFYRVKGIRREGTKIKGGVNSPPTTPRPEFTPPPQNPARDFKWEADEHFRQQQARREARREADDNFRQQQTRREADEHFRQQQTRREADDNFMLGAIVGGVIVDSLNEDNSHKAIEAEHIEPVYLFGNSEGGNNGSYSSSSDSDYIPSSSSSYDGGGYSSSSDSGSSSSCDSGC